MPTASKALWRGLRNITTSNVSIEAAQTTGGAEITLILNENGMLLFAYVNVNIVS